MTIDSATVLLFCFAYLLGSVNNAVLFCNLFALPDPRQDGSHNPGATNVYRLGGKYPALLTLLFDLLKGALSVAIAIALDFPPQLAGWIGLVACIGHSYPLFFQFKGGKAVATALGATLPINWLIACIASLIWLLILRLSGYASAAAIVSVLSVPAMAAYLEPRFFPACCAISLLVLFRHKENILRLYKGRENSP